MDYHGIPLPGENAPNGSPHLIWSQNGGCYLVKQRLKQMGICPVEQNHFDWSPAESFGCCQAVKPPPTITTRGSFSFIGRPGNRITVRELPFLPGRAGPREQIKLRGQNRVNENRFKASS